MKKGYIKQFWNGVCLEEETRNSWMQEATTGMSEKHGMDQ
jgi:hypothetical protein